MPAVVCPGCRRSLSVPDRLVGKSLRCPFCQRPVPSPSVPAVNEVAAVGDTPYGGAHGAGPYPFLAPPQGTGELGRLGGYRVLKELGRGGMGVVFLAEETAGGRRVALKVM